MVEKVRNISRSTARPLIKKKYSRAASKWYFKRLLELTSHDYMKERNDIRPIARKELKQKKWLRQKGENA